MSADTYLHILCNYRLIQRKLECISSIHSILVQFKTNIECSSNEVSVEVVTDNLNIINSFSQDLLETSQEILGKLFQNKYMHTDDYQGMGRVNKSQEIYPPQALC